MTLVPLNQWLIPKKLLDFPKGIIRACLPCPAFAGRQAAKVGLRREMTTRPIILSAF
ncbi:MAG: hypothetical protein WD361_02345 [Gracilimonas sp.]